MTTLDLTDLKRQLPGAVPADDALLTELLAVAAAFAGSYCGRDFAGGTFTEEHPGGSRALFLRNYPVSGGVSVRVDPARAFGPGTLLDPAAYVVHAGRGVITHPAGPFVPPGPLGRLGRPAGDSPGAVRVTYSTATDAVPGAVRRAVAELVGHWFRQAKTHEATGQENLLTRTEAGGAVTAYPWGQSSGFRVPPGVLQLLGSARTPPT